MINEIKKLLVPYNFDNLQRYGGSYDGGYILAEDLLNKSEIIYSYGVGPDESWITFDRQMAKLKKTVYLYDNLKNGFWVNDNPFFVFKSEYVNSKNIYSHIIENNHSDKTNMILKLDIEGNEYETLLNCSESLFNHFDQLAIEVHDVVNSHLEPYYLINADDTKKRWENKLRLFNKLNKFYYLVHMHGNNNSFKIIDEVPDVLELLYIRKDKFQKLEKRAYPFPIGGLDYPNNPSQPDIILDWWLKHD
jgi:transcription antitermination factor NusG